jgi:hypothetical protein
LSWTRDFPLQKTPSSRKVSIDGKLMIALELLEVFLLMEDLHLVEVFLLMEDIRPSHKVCARPLHGGSS